MKMPIGAQFSFCRLEKSSFNLLATYEHRGHDGPPDWRVSRCPCGVRDDAGARAPTAVGQTQFLRCASCLREADWSNWEFQ
jgi:hypothetical protein